MRVKCYFYKFRCKNSIFYHENSKKYALCRLFQQIITHIHYIHPIVQSVCWNGIVG